METFIIAALSTDGFIAQHASQASTDWTSPEDQLFFQEKTKGAGVVVMGRTTFETIKKPLPDRLNIVYTSQNRQDFLANQGLEEKQGLEDNGQSLENLQVTGLEPRLLIEQLREQGFNQAAICGGSSIYTQFMQSGLVNKLYLTMEPVMFGAGIKLFKQPVSRTLNLSSYQQLNPQKTMLLEYEVS